MAAAQRQISNENIIKQGYLKRSIQTSELIPSMHKQFANNIKQKLEPNRWYVFGVRNRRPYLEYYEKEEGIFTGHALQTYDLSTFQSLSYTMGRTNTNFTFCIFLADQVIDLTAPSRAHMIEWCRCLERHLRNLGIRSKNIKEDHQYTPFPVKKIPRPPAEDPPNIDTHNDFFLAESLQFDSEDDDQEAEDHNYQEAEPLKDGVDSDGDNTRTKDDSTLPVRPPPRIPKEEDVFADLSTVRRDEMYTNLRDHRGIVMDNEKHLFGEGSDCDSGADNDDDDNCISDDHGGLVNGARRQDCDLFEDDSGDRWTGLPPLVKTSVQESDTSEDADFVSTSFWVRNRKSDIASLDLETSADQVPLRSACQRPKPVPRNCVSMNMSLTCPVKDLAEIAVSNRDYDNPPPPRRLVNQVPVSRKKSNESTIVVVDQVVKCENGNTVFLLEDDTEESDSEDSTVKTKSEIPGKNNNLDIHCGDYETLTQASFPKRCTDKSSEKVDRMDCRNAEQSGRLYEAAWMCSTARNSSHSDDDCCKKERSVDLPKDGDCKSKGEANGQTADNCRTDTNVKESVKQKGLVDRFFSRKSSKSKKLPESLTVNLPPSAAHGNCTSGEPGLSGGNFYSDLPMEEPVLDSDILKLSILQNGPSVKNETPIALPPRQLKDTHANPKSLADHIVHIGARPKERNVLKSVENSSQSFGLDEYEPVDISKTSAEMRKRPPMPLPDETSAKNLTDQSCTEAPVAPPRRKKSDKSTPERASPELELPERKLRSPVSPPIPGKRHSLHSPGSSRSGSQEIPVPPRLNPPSKPALPPPPRPAPLSRAASDVSGSSRPRSIHLASRQQSTSQPSAVHVMNLKQNQVDILKSEMDSTGGLVKVISKVHFQSGLAFVECFGKIWIAGWDVRKYPKLYDKFHIGDELVSINDVQVTDLAFANKLIKNVKAESIEITVRRLPHARVFAIQRSGEGENLGIKREGGTAEIIYVDPLGLASRYGLPSKAISMDGSGHCNWCLTEINMRALNLFFKDNEIEHRLLAVGRDISIVVQPVDFIKEIKKQFKKLKNYKSYIIH